MNTDVVIIGKGIAGLVLSFLLEKEGINHLVLDRANKKKNMALAETLPPSAIPLLQSLGLYNVFIENVIQKTYGYHSLWGNERIIDHNFFFNPGHNNGLKIDKKAITTSLQKGTEKHIVAYEHLSEIQVSKEEISIAITHNGQQRKIECKIVIDATGRNRAVLKKLNIPIKQYDTIRSFSCHVPRIKHPKLVHSVFVESFEHGWGIVSGLDEKTSVFSIFTNKGNSIQKKLKNYKKWPSVLSETSILKDFWVNDITIKILGADANSAKPIKVAGENWLAIGDAALSFDPLSSHGITNAIFMAKEASNAIVDCLKHNKKDGFTSYEKKILSIFDRYWIQRKQLYKTETRWKSSFFWTDFFDQETVLHTSNFD
ncbi:NAD(P)/FAD-dependent oxidoreductase [Aquimarina aquimarini]|uniref:NAD(P)/FAD-dependent oxidoreductase n=1 Tax=Aquimarina aquimarini TaxID=1191734 RepID=UPI000D561447|nr:FAD-dependent monooxygenase [Aquimarina aquimarini]